MLFIFNPAVSGTPTSVDAPATGTGRRHHVTPGANARPAEDEPRPRPCKWRLHSRGDKGGGCQRNEARPGWGCGCTAAPRARPPCARSPGAFPAWALWEPGRPGPRARDGRKQDPEGQAPGRADAGRRPTPPHLRPGRARPRARLSCGRHGPQPLRSQDPPQSHGGPRKQRADVQGAPGASLRRSHLASPTLELPLLPPANV